MITCDRCGQSTAAVYEYHHGTATITLCYHHAQAHGPTLTAQGWAAVTLPAADNLVTNR